MNASFALRTVLVHHDGSPRADYLVKSARDVAGSGARVVVLAVTCVPASLPLRGLPPEVDQRAHNSLRWAREVALRHGFQIETKYRRARDLARAIIIEAQMVDADAIFMTVDPPRFAWLRPRLSGTARDVLRYTPCPVIIGYFPKAAALDASAAVAEVERIVMHSS